MLVLTRKSGQVIRIGEDIKIEVVSVNGDHVKIGISAPQDTTILREEIYQTIISQNRNSVLDQNETSNLVLSELKLTMNIQKQK